MSDFQKKSILFNEKELQDRISELEALTQSTKYSKQKQSLKHELCEFLSALNPPKSLDDALPSDVRLFIAFKDGKGKTKVHKEGCVASRYDGQCECPHRRSAGSVDSLIGQLRAIFRDHGRGTDWIDNFGVGNPAAAAIIKQYLKAIKLEQSSAAVTSKHAVPIFIDKLTLVLRHIHYQIRNPSLKVYMKFVFLRDSAMLNLLVYTGDRAGDLGELRTDNIRRLPNDEGVVITMCKGKTIDVQDPRVVPVLSNHVKEYCPIKTLRLYVDFCEKNDISLKGGYFFRPLDNKNKPVNKPLSSSALNARLKTYLQRLNIFEGETPHGTRSGCALTLSWLGLDKEVIKSHVGWKSDKMLEHYTKVNDLVLRHGSAKALAECGTYKREVASNFDILQKYRNRDSFDPVVK